MMIYQLVSRMKRHASRLGCWRYVPLYHNTRMRQKYHNPLFLLIKHSKGRPEHYPWYPHNRKKSGDCGWRANLTAWIPSTMGATARAGLLLRMPSSLMVRFLPLWTGKHCRQRQRLCRTCERWPIHRQTDRQHILPQHITYLVNTLVRSRGEEHST